MTEQEAIHALQLQNIELQLKGIRELMDNRFGALADNMGDLKGRVFGLEQINREADLRSRDNTTLILSVTDSVQKLSVKIDECEDANNDFWKNFIVKTMQLFLAVGGAGVIIGTILSAIN